uniref:Uncharacterized protein n=1 Tax=Oryza nivara TaxID=4536 RepID=A0A0E0IIT6_ORYNI
MHVGGDTALAVGLEAARWPRWRRPRRRKPQGGVAVASTVEASRRRHGGLGSGGPRGSAERGAAAAMEVNGDQIRVLFLSLPFAGGSARWQWWRSPRQHGDIPGDALVAANY